MSTRISQSGPATPDHVIRTKPLPMLGRDVDGFVVGLSRAISTTTRRQAKEPKTMLDRRRAWRSIRSSASPRSAARRRTSRIVEDLYEHTIEVILRAEALGGWQALEPQAHLRHRVLGSRAGQAEEGRQRRPRSPARSRVVTGAASGIGKACAEALLKRGAAVVGLDRNPGDRGAVEAPGLSRAALRPDRSCGNRCGARRSRQALRRRRHAGAERRHLPRLASRSRTLGERRRGAAP